MTVVTIPQLEAAVNGLAGIGVAEMTDPATRALIPPLYGGRIRYLREPVDKEEWQTPLITAQLGTGDCEDLAAYRIAELHVQGETEAKARVLRISPVLRHVVVARASGHIEDPSAKLGMSGKA